MKIVIHGTKGGYHIFTAERIPGFIDARPDYNKVAAIGQEAYAINFNNYNAVLSKYKIIRDVPGEKRMGNVAFSVVIPNNKKFSGADAKDLLDKLSTWYCKEYIDGDNLNNVREDWNFVDTLTGEYENKLTSIPRDEVEDIQQGTGEAAFVYYSTDMELEKYLAEPYQQEYKRFKQIFFVKNELDGQAENPLNALRHNPSSNLTGQIDLNNPWYKLQYSENTKSGVKIEVMANGLRCKNNSKIRRKTDLDISYSKQHYDGETITSKWDEINTELVDVNDAAQTITIREKELPPKTKPIKFEVQNGKNKPITDADIYYENYQTKEKKRVNNNEVVFKGEELKDKWIVSGKKNKLEGQIEFIPENQPANIVLVLVERKTVRITARDQDNDEVINGIIIEVSQKLRSRGNEIDFVGEEIYETWIITISHDDYDRKTFRYCASSDDNPKTVRLQKLQPSNGGGENKKYYRVSAGEHGKLKDGNEYISRKKDGHDVIDKIIPKMGYEFLKFKLIGDTLVANYQRIPFYKNPIFIAIIVVSAIVLFSAYKYDLFKRSPKDNTGEIISYCDGNDLFAHELENYQKTYCIESKPEYCKKIKNALEIRTAINEGSIDLLKTFDYSISQDSLKKTVNNVSDKFKEKIAITLQTYPASELNLLQVADVITKLQKLLQIPVTNLRSERDCEDRLQLIKGWGLREDLAIVKSITEQINTKKRTFTPNEEGQTVQTNPKPESTHDTDKSNQQNQTQSASGKSAFEIKFWALVKGGIEQKETYDALRKSYKSKNATLADMAILNYLRVITKDSESFLKFKGLPKGDRIVANDLSQIKIEEK